MNARQTKMMKSRPMSLENRMNIVIAIRLSLDAEALKTLVQTELKSIEYL